MKKTTTKKQKTLTKIQKTYNLLKSGKKVTVTTIAKRLYGAATVQSEENARRIILHLRSDKGYKIDSLGNKQYKLFMD